MQRRRHSRRKAKPPKPRLELFKAAELPPDVIPLETFNLEEIKKLGAHGENVLRLQWELHASLAYQRSLVAEKITAALIQAAQGPLRFEGWRRHVSYRYTLNPLSPAGSLRAPGGRFNIPEIQPDRIPSFPALYLAENVDTALLEARGQPNDDAGTGLTSMELALQKAGSFAVMALNGRLDSVIDLTGNIDVLTPLIEIINKFEVPDHIKVMAAEKGLQEPTLICTMEEFRRRILFPNWRQMPMMTDIPATCQIFGQLVAAAKIEGIVYPSKLNGGKCLAVFPQNLFNDSYVELAEEPVAGTKIRRLDAKTWAGVQAEGAQ